MDERYDFFKKLVSKSQDIAIQNWNEFKETSYKTPKDPVTKVDKEIEEKLSQMISKRYPSHSITGEESGSKEKDSDYEWLIDPIDGTTNYCRKVPFFSTSIALLKKGEVIESVVNNPFLKETFYAKKGGGALLNGNEISVSEESSIGTSFFGYCHGSTEEDLSSIVKVYSKLKPILRDMRRFGSSSLEFAYVACGRLDGFILTGRPVWDFAAGKLLVEEAGGKVTNLRSSLSGKNALATNGNIHEEIIKIIEEV